MALAHPAQAKIVYTPARVVIKVQEHYNIDLNRDGVTDFTIQLQFSHSRGGYFTSLSALSPKGNAVEGGKIDTSKGREDYAFALQRGSKIGAQQPFSGQVMAWVGSEHGGILYAGQWLYAKDRYLGLKFQIQGKVHFGWARLSVANTRRNINSVKLTGYAYETVPNKPIIAGKTHGPDVVTVQPASLGHLARGASAIPAWRTKQ